MTLNETMNSTLHWPWHRPEADYQQKTEAVPVFHGFAVLQEKLAQWQAIRYFEGMDDQNLQDIGIERYQIREFVLNGEHR